MQETNPLTGLREAVAEAVRVELARRRMTQRGLADATGLKRSYVGRRMTGEVPWTTDDLEKISTALTVPLSTLLPIEKQAA